MLLTIDNTDGALPIEYAEVTISRTMFRSGGSEYAINGTPCRLLDVQELLSDSGIGREMHVIVGQGQLDTILHATPEDRRGFIEEAAGVLKHRKRKEKALRKLDSTDGNLTRLNDLLGEIRRQLKPLGRQAEVARRAAGVQADVRDARARLIADDLVTARTALEQELADETILVERRAEVEAAIAARPRGRGRASRPALREDLPALAGAQETWFALCGLRERLRGTQSLAAERVRNAGAVEEPADSGRDPDQLEAEAARVARAGAGDRRRGRAAARRPRAGASPPGGPPRTPPPRRSAGSPACSAPPPTAARAWPGCTARSTRCKSRAAAADDEIGRLGQAREDARRPRRARPARLHRASRPGSPGSTPARRGSTPSTRRPPPPSTTSRSGSPRPARRRSRPTATGPRCSPARTPSRWASTARTAPARCSPPPTPSPACSARSPRCSPSAPATRPPSPAPSAPPPTPSPSATPTPPSRRSATSRPTTSAGPGCCSAGGRAPTDRDWPGLPGHATYAVDVVDCPGDLRGALSRLLFKVAVVDDLDAARGPGRRAARPHRGDPRRRRASAPTSPPAAPRASRA